MISREAVLRIIAYILIAYGVIGLLLFRLGIWTSPPVDTFYYAFAFGLYLDVRADLREFRRGSRREIEDIRADLREFRKEIGKEIRSIRADMKELRREIRALRKG